MIEKIKKIFSWLKHGEKIHVIPFVLKKHNKLKPFCIVVKTFEFNNKHEVSWTKLAKYNEEASLWVWESNNADVDFKKGWNTPSIQEAIRKKVNIQYLLN